MFFFYFFFLLLNMLKNPENLENLFENLGGKLRKTQEKSWEKQENVEAKKKILGTSRKTGEKFEENIVKLVSNLKNVEN